MTNLGLTALVWDEQTESSKDQGQQGEVLVSVYLNQDRSQALFATLLDVDAG